MRTAFFQTLERLAADNPRIFLVTGDLGFSVVDEFARRHPAQFLNVGVAEQNMTGVAAGLALSGKIVFTYSIANFPTLRCLEQIRNDVCYHRADVKIVSVGGGYSYGALGSSHHATEDLAVLRAMPEMCVVVPGGPREAECATRAVVARPGPCYLRLGRAGEPAIHAKPFDFRIGRALTVREGADLTLIATGSAVPIAVGAAENLAARGLQARVLSMHTIKPLDAEAVVRAMRETRVILTVEEHSVVGGLGGAVAEVIAQEAAPSVPFRILGLPDAFCRDVGSQNYLRRRAGLSPEDVATAAQALHERAIRRIYSTPPPTPPGDGGEDEGSPDFPVSDDVLRRMYQSMLRIRICEERIAKLIDQKEIQCPCHLCIGQEAVPAGVCAALEPADMVWGGHRSHGHYLAKGGDLPAMMAELLGRRTGCSGGRGGSMHLIDPAAGVMGTVPIVAATIPLGAGSALASKLRGDGRVTVCFFGDGAVEEGHFHESLNLAALYRLPVVFVCENNYYSSHMQLLERRREDNIPVAAEAHGIPGLRLDGNDAVAVHRAAVRAVRRARKGQGPTLLECRTYRWRGHVGSDWNLDVGVKRRDELKEWMARDPIPRLRCRLEEGDAGAFLPDEIEREVREEVDRAVAFARGSPPPEPSALLAHVFGS